MAQATSYANTEVNKRVVSDLIDIISPMDIPAIKYFGLAGDPDQFRLVNFPGTKIEWLEDSLAALTDTLDGSIAAGCATMDVNYGTRFKSGDVILIGSEYFWISGVASDTLTVDPYSGSEADHLDEATVTRVSQARLEGDAADYERSPSTISAPYNYSQIFQADIDVSRTDNLITKYGMADLFGYQTMKNVHELSRLINKSFYTGVCKAGSATTPRAFGGLDAFLSTNHSAGGAGALTETRLYAIIEDCYDNGGNPDVIFVNSFQKQKISGFFEDRIRSTIDESRGGVRISEVETEWGLLKIVMDRWCPADSLYVLESQYVGFVSIDPFFEETLAKVGDATRGQVVGEFSLVVKNESAHGRWTGLSTS